MSPKNQENDKPRRRRQTCGETQADVANPGEHKIMIMVIVGLIL
jgi:hypothetical protein